MEKIRKLSKIILTILCVICMTAGSFSSLSVTARADGISDSEILQEPVSEEYPTETAATEPVPETEPASETPSTSPAPETPAAEPAAQVPEAWTTAPSVPEPEGTAAAVRPADETKKLVKEVLASDGRKYLIEVSYKADSNIPAGTELVVNEVRNPESYTPEEKKLIQRPEKQKTEEEKREEAVNANYSDYLRSSAEILKEEEKDLTFAIAFDIMLKDPATKKEFQPDKDVQVMVQLVDIALEQDAKIDIIHFDETKKEEEAEKAKKLLPAAAAGDKKAKAEQKEAELFSKIGKPEQIKTETEANTAKFETDGFSVYVVTAKTQEQKLYASDGATYRITASYDYTAGIPKDAQLIASEILPEEDAYEACLAETVKTIGASVENVTFAKPLDIFFLDPATGDHIKPDRDVAVSIELSGAARSAKEKVSVVHFGTRPETVEASADGNTVSFANDDFSVYVVVFTAEEGEDPEPSVLEYECELSDSEEILLSELISRLGITAFAFDDITSAVSSDPDKLRSDEIPEDPEEGTSADWSLHVLEAFQDVDLTLTLENEDMVIIHASAEEARHNPKLSVTGHVYDPETNIITYTAVVEAEGNIDNGGNDYPVAIRLIDPEDPSRTFLSGSYSYAHPEDFDPEEGAPESLVNGTGVDTAPEGEITSSSVTAAHMYDGDTLTLTYTVQVVRPEYMGNKTARVENTVLIDNSGNPYDDPEDDAVSVTTSFEYLLVRKKCVSLDGSWASWEIVVNPDAYTLNGGQPLILKDSFNSDDDTYGEQSIDYSSIRIVPDAGVSYDYSGSTGTFVIPDAASLTITYNARVIKADPGENKTFGGAVLLQKEEEGETVTIEEGFGEYSGVIYPSASDAASTTGEYMIRLYVYEDGNMQTGIEGAEFILMDANKRPIKYDPEDVDTAIRFTTGTDGYVNVRPDRTAGFALEKNTAYYLEMIKAPSGFKKDNTLYSFMITDDPSYESGGVYTYYNGDTMKVRLYPESPGLNVSVRFSGNYTLREDQSGDINVILQKQDPNTGDWINIENHYYSEFSYGSYAFAAGTEAAPFEVGALYRVIQENARPWDLDQDVHDSIAYYLVSGDNASQAPEDEPIEFLIDEDNKNISFNAVMNNEYEEHKLTITKMDKLTGKTLANAEFQVKKAVGDQVVKTYRTDAGGVIEIAGGADFESEILYYVVETEAPEEHLLPLVPKKIYFYFCNDPYLEPEIKRDLPPGETAVNLSETYDSLSLDNQEEKVTIPVMATWQGGIWPGTDDSPISVTIGLYRSVNGGDPEAVLDENDQPLTVTLTKGASYNSDRFKDLPVREEGQPITYSIIEEEIRQDEADLMDAYVREYGISDSGVYIVRNRKATALTVRKTWFDPADPEQDITDPAVLDSQSDVIFDLYRSTSMIPEELRENGITNAEMAAFVSSAGVAKIRSGLTLDKEQGWTKVISDIEERDDSGNLYYYYVFENVPSFGDEIYVPEEDSGTITIRNPKAPPRVGLTVEKAALVADPRPEAVNTDFEFTLLLKKGDHVIRNYTVYTDGDHPENTLATDWDGKVTFTLKPEQSKILSLPAGVTATITEKLNREYHESAAGTVTDQETEEGNIFRYDTAEDQNVTVTYTNTLHVFCKVVDSNGEEHPFESLKSALEYIHANPTETIIHDGFAKIEMIEDYEMQPKDEFALEADEKIILTTAETTGCTFPFITDRTEDADKAIITRVEGGDTLLENAGELTIEKLIIDGGGAAAEEEEYPGYTFEGDGGIVYNTGTLNLNAGTVLRNSFVSGKGGAIYSSGTINISGYTNMTDDAVISGNAAESGSAIYLADGILNMTGGEIHSNTVEDNGAVAVENPDVQIRLSGNVRIHSNTDTADRAANLYLGADSDRVISVVAPGLGAEADIWVKPIQGHREIGEQFATADHGAGEHNTNCFVNDLYEYRGKLKEGTATNIIWNGLDLTLNKIVPPEGANPHDRFTITLSSMSIRRNSYQIDGTLDYDVTQAGQNPGTIVFNDVKAEDRFTIHGLPVGEYTLSEAASDYEPGYSGENAETGEDIDFLNGTFTMSGNSTVDITNTRKKANINLKKTMQDRLVGDAQVPFDFEITLKDPDGTAISNFTLADGIVTDARGKANLSMSPTNAAAAGKTVDAPVGTVMTIRETTPDYRITFTATTPTGAASGETIPDSAEAEDTFEFEVPAGGANIGISNVRKMAHIQLTNNLVNKVSTDEAFNLTVTLTNHDDSPAANYTMYEDPDHPENNITTDEDGVAILPCNFPENVTARGFTLDIPEGTHLKVTEAAKEGTGTDLLNYDISYAVDGASKTNVDIPSVTESIESIVITNTRKTRTITVSNTVNGYSGNVQAFRFTATVEDQAGDKDYDSNGFTNGVMTFELTTGQSRILTVPYNASLNIKEQYVIGYETVIKRGSSPDSDVDTEIEFTVENNDTVAFTNNQLISIVLVNQTSVALENVQVYTAYGTKMYRVNDAGDGQDEVTVTNHWATVSIGAGKTAILEVNHQNSQTAEQNYTVSGSGPAAGYYYTIQNEPSFHEFADPAFLRIYDTQAFEVKGKLRYSVSDSTVTFTEQPLVSFDANGGVWTTEMEGYRDRDGDRQVYQFAAEKGEAVSAPQPDPVYPTAEGITFLGWTEDENYAKADHSDGQVDSSKLYDFSTPVNSPVNLYAIWSKGDTRTVTVDNAIAGSLTITATLSNTTPIEGIVLADGAVTDQNGTATFTLESGEKKNLRIPDGAKLVLAASGASCMEYSSVYSDTDSAAQSFTINSVDRDGTISFIAGICKITDSDGNILYNNSGQPAVYGTLAAAFTAYNGTLYTDAAHTTPAAQAAVKMLIDEYAISSKHAFPTRNVIVTTAGKDDADFPYVGVRERATLYRAASYTSDCLFTLENAGREVTLTDIILDGHNVPAAKTILGSLIYVSHDNAVLNVTTGTVFRNVVFAAYSEANKASGGAIYINKGTLNVNAGLFSNLKARRGGAINAEGSATLNITGTNGSTRFENCTTDSSSTNNAGGDGGAIYYSSAKDLTINGGIDEDKSGIIFKECRAGSNWGDGGAILADTGYNHAVSVSGCAFIECSARNNSGGNTDGTGGGAINGYHVSKLNVSYSTFEACDSLRAAGAVECYVKTTEAEDNKAIVLTYCTFTDCNSKGQGGAVAVYQDNNSASNSRTELIIDGCSFSNCSSGTVNGSGGAIQSYLPCMQFEYSSFTDCWAGKEGGAFNNWYGGDNAIWPNSYMNVIGCTFIRCRAEDRYEIGQVYHYGGGIATKANTLLIDDSYFEDCVSTLQGGGAVYCSAHGDSSSATVTGTTFKNCQAKLNGGALSASNKAMIVENSYFYGCSSSAGNGGALYHGNGLNTRTQTQTTIENCTFSADPENSSSASCSAAGDGGAVWTRAQNVEITDCTINGCEAVGKGGGIYLSKNSSLSAVISGGIISGCQATNGSAVFQEGNTTYSFIKEDDSEQKFERLTITGNNATDANGGAIARSGDNMYFEGNVYIKDNTCNADSVDHNVVLANDSNTIINTTNKGLDGSSEIGVYVTDAANVFSKHGSEGQPFGTWAKVNDALDCFINDRVEGLNGYQSAENDNKIYWGFYICKITDAIGNTLKRPSGKDAVYQRLTMAIDDFTKVKDDNNETGKAVYIKMLEETYEIKQTGQIESFPNANITLTTASKTEPDSKYPYRGTEGTVCTISRTNSTNQLFKLANANATFRLENITLDGRRDKTADVGEYRLVEVSAGSLVVSGGTTLQYGKQSNGTNDGGAIRASGSSTSVIVEGTLVNPVHISNCTASAAGGAIYVNGCSFTVNGEKSGNQYGVLFDSCQSTTTGNSYGGGAIYHYNCAISVTGASFTNCRTSGRGGAIQTYNGNTNQPMTVSSCLFSNCYGKVSGGAINSRTNPMTVSDTVFEGCLSGAEGGAINHDHNSSNQITLTNVVCRNCGTDPDSTQGTQYRNGGAIRSNALNATVTGGSFINCRSYGNGGALCFDRDANGTKTITGTTFQNCQAENGSGGAIWFTTGRMTITDATIDNCIAKEYSGAVYGNKENATTVLNISGRTKISHCYAKQGGAIYLKKTTTMNLTDSNGRPEFSNNGYANLNGTEIDSEKGACIYLAEGSKLNISGSPVFKRNILPYSKEQIVNGGELDYVRQDIYLAGYKNTMNVSSINISGEITARTGDDMIWVWPEESPHKLPGDQFAATAANVPEASLNRFRNALADNTTGCSDGEYLAGVRLYNNTGNAYWSKMYSISFRKIDDKAVGVPDAGFTLYRNPACEEADAFATAYSSGQGSDKGKVLFTSIPIGAYYLKETDLPDSFGREEGIEKYLVLVGTPMLLPNENNQDVWGPDGPLSNDTETINLVTQNTTGAGKYFGIYPINKTTGKADVSINRASATSGVKNIRIDFEAYFMKVDGNGDALPGAQFTIFSQEVDEEEQPVSYDNGYPMLELWTRDGEHYPDPVASADGTNKYKDRAGDNLPKGLVYFPELPVGTYYLLESTYPTRNGSNRRTSYVETDRLFQLNVISSTEFEIKEWTEAVDPETGKHYAEYIEVKKEEKASYKGKLCYQIANEEAVCKLTDDSGSLLYSLGHDGTTILPAVYPTLEEGFEAARSATLVNASRATVVDEETNAPLQLHALKDFILSEPVTYNNSTRPLTFTTASRTETKTDHFIFITNRTTDPSRAMISRDYDEPAAGALLNIDNVSLTLQNINLNGQKTNYTGRAVNVSSGSLIISTNTLLQNFKSNGNGGAVFVNSGASLEINGGSSRSAVFNDNVASDGGAVFAADGSSAEIKNAQFNRNAASGNGGAIRLADIMAPDPENPSEIRLENTVFNNNTSSGNGGGLYIGENRNVTLMNTSFTGNTAGDPEGSTGEGGAAYAAGNTNTTIHTTATTNYGGITGNSARGADGGAINVSSDNAKLYFEGSPIIFNNKNGDGEQKNVVLAKDSNDVIHTGSSGLTGGLIGIYVTDGVDRYQTHGLPDQPFGTFGDTAKVNAEFFRNDRNLALYGVKNEKDETDGSIYWNGVVCKLTDPQDRLLYENIEIRVGSSWHTDITAPAIHAAVQEGFDAAQGDLYGYHETKPVKYDEIQVKMLRDVDLSNAVTYKKGKGNRKLVWTTAETEVSEAMEQIEDSFVFRTDRKDREDQMETIALIGREADFTGNSMVSASGKSLMLKSIILDGSLPEGRVMSANGGILNVGSSGTTTTISEGAVLRNANAGSNNGGAVYVNSGGKLIMDGGTISGSHAANGGAVYLVNGSQMTLSGGEISGNSGGSGGAVFLFRGANLTMSGGAVKNNAADTGAGIFLSEGSNMYLYGAPDFGGSGVDASGVSDLSGNFAVQPSFRGDEANGGMAYPTDSEDRYIARQDIYIAGYQGEDGNTNAGSLTITGDISSGDGTIWIWAEQTPHYKTLEQFAKIGGSVPARALSALRNARPDSLTGTGGTYLHGATGEDPSSVYWGGVRGSRKVILRKASASTYYPLSGAVFTIYQGSAATEYVTEDGQHLTGLTSSDSGIIWTGMLPYGTYYLYESQAPAGYGSNAGKWFCLIVDESGNFMSANGYPDKNLAFAEADTMRRAAP